MMWGADTPLVIDALIIAGIAVAGGAGLTMLVTRLRRKPEALKPTPKSSLEERVQVLERIATDRSHDLAEEIDALREPNNAKGAI